MKRWTRVVDLSLGLVALACVAVFAAAPAGSRWRWTLPLVLGALVLHRILLYAERPRPAVAPAGPADPDAPLDLPEAA